MARPTKKQIAARKDGAREERRAARLERGYRITPLLSLADFTVIECEACGQEQTTRTFDDTVDPLDWWDPVVTITPCVVCGHKIARTAATHMSFLREAQELLRVELLVA